MLCYKVDRDVEEANDCKYIMSSAYSA